MYPFFQKKGKENRPHFPFYPKNSIPIYAPYIKTYIRPFALLILFFGGIIGNSANITIEIHNILKSML